MRSEALRLVRCMPPTWPHPPCSGAGGGDGSGGPGAPQGVRTDGRRHRRPAAAGQQPRDGSRRGCAHRNTPWDVCISQAGCRCCCQPTVPDALRSGSCSADGTACGCLRLCSHTRSSCSCHAAPSAKAHVDSEAALGPADGWQAVVRASLAGGGAADERLLLLRHWGPVSRAALVQARAHPAAPPLLLPVSLPPDLNPESLHPALARPMCVGSARPGPTSSGLGFRLIELLVHACDRPATHHRPPATTTHHRPHPSTCAVSTRW
jgi:hypothetical protein